MLIKMKHFNVKTFCEATVSRLKEIIQPPPPPPPPPPGESLRLWNKNFPTEIYRNIHLLFKCFANAVLGRLEMVQCKRVF